MLEKHLREILYPYPKLTRLWHVCQRLIFRKIAFDLFFVFGMSTARSFIQAINTSGADIVIFSHPWAIASVPKRKNVIWIYDAHNCEYSLANQILGSHPYKALILRRVKEIEGKACAQSDAIFVCSGEQQEEMKTAYGLQESRFVLAANGTKICQRPTAKEKIEAKNKLGFKENNPLILFIGSYFTPNIEAAEWIVGTLAKTLGMCRLLLVGELQKAFRKQTLPGNVTCTGRVDEETLEVILKAAEIGINPVLMGSGTNIKLLDYLGAGLPVVSTALGCRGLALEHKKNVWISGREHFSKSIETLLGDANLSNALGQEGHDFVKEHHDWKKISSMLQERIWQLTQNRIDP
ncbi:MAG: glycosyltransferase family 4 protein [Candidatus Omnitrophota bacterium]